MNLMFKVVKFKTKTYSYIVDRLIKRYGNLKVVFFLKKAKGVKKVQSD